MPTIISSPGNSNTTVRWKEPYVSSGLNKKGIGSIPNGIVRGGILETAGAGLNVQIGVDPDTGDSVYVFTTSTGDHQLTHRETALRALDLTAVANTTVYIALYIQYSIGSVTLVEWRAYTEAELFGGAPVAEAGNVVILGKVDVPAAGPIPAANVDMSGATFAWKDTAPGSKKWTQIVENGSFELGDPGSSNPNRIPGFSFEYTGSQSDIDVENVSANSGDWSLRIDITGPAETVIFGQGAFSSAGPYSTGVNYVNAGQVVDASFYLEGTTAPAYSAGTSGVRLVFEFYDDSGALLATEQAASDPSVHVGTFSWARVNRMFQAPVRGYMKWYMFAGNDGGACQWLIDDIEIYIQPQSGNFDASPDVPAVVRSTKFELSPHDLTSLDLVNSRTVGIEVQGAGGTNKAISIGDNSLRWLTPFIFDDFYFTPSENTYGLLGSEGHPDGSEPYYLIHKYAIDASGMHARVYINDDKAFVKTINAVWSNGTMLWNRDVSGSPAMKFVMLNGSADPSHFLFQHMDDNVPVAWSDAAWDRSQGVFVNGSGDLEYIDPVQRQKFISLNSLSQYSVQETGATPAPSARVVVGGHYLENATSNMGIYIPIHDFLPNGSELVEAQFGMRGAAAGGGYDMRVERRSPDIATTPPVNTAAATERVSQTDTWGPAALESHITLSTNNNGAGGMVLPHAIDYSFEYRLLLVVSAGVGDFEMTYFLITYNDPGPGGR